MTNDYLNEWLHHLEINKNYSEHTFQSYGRDLKEYLKYCKINQLDLMSPTQDTIRGFLFELNIKKLSKYFFSNLNLLKKNYPKVIKDIRMFISIMKLCLFFRQKINIQTFPCSLGYIIQE